MEPLTPQLFLNCLLVATPPLNSIAVVILDVLVLHDPVGDVGLVVDPLLKHLRDMCLILLKNLEIII